MNRLLLAGIALQLSALPVLAQNTTPTPARPPAAAPATTSAKPMTTTDATTDNRSNRSNATAASGAVPGANSFTEAQARSRLEKNGYSQVSGLAKGDDGIWRGAATKNGSSVHVSVDYKGNISAN